MYAFFYYHHCFFQVFFLSLRLSFFGFIFRMIIDCLSNLLICVVFLGFVVPPSFVYLSCGCHRSLWM
ncbi:hypothetical protein QVD17_38238 [Tagetes erecta]|uniref:Uncharacterized protein n=1 Tax=Tagetes erecta TaxID=13708 RepID=A0AAD8JVF1_TARER|nr:hypothetical protein QVD17_38238 [Tagetes erecta]